jgi:hypothetical protein
VRVTGARSVAAGGVVAAAVGGSVAAGSVGEMGAVGEMGMVGAGVVAAGVDTASSVTALAMPIEATRPNIVATPRPALAILDPLAG